MKYRYTIAAWDLKDGEQVNEVEQSVIADSEGEAVDISNDMAAREFNKTMHIEQIVVEEVSPQGDETT